MISRNILLLLAIGSVFGCKAKDKEASSPRPAAADGKPKTSDAPQKPSTPSTPSIPTTPPVVEAITYPVPDPELGEELAEGEEKAAGEVRDVIVEQIKSRYAPSTGKRALRDAHPKTHGCLKAEFTVDPGIRPEYAHGVFTKGSKYETVIRFSNSSGDPTQADIVKDGRGMAFKLLGVPGKKLLEVESQAVSQDFIFISHPVFFIKDPVEYIDFIKHFESSDLLSMLATAKTLGVQGVSIATAIKSRQISSPIQIEYFSNVPYQLGVGAAKKAVKYNARPCTINGSDPVPTDTKDPNYLRTRLIDHFKTSDACMDIYVQARTDDKMSVEDSRIEWKTPWSKVATLTIKKSNQDIAPTPEATIASNKACDTLSFNPWHSLPEHKPLGSMNRVRKIVYEHISKLRHEMNKEPRQEPAAPAAAAKPQTK